MDLAYLRVIKDLYTYFVKKGSITYVLVKPGLGMP